MSNLGGLEIMMVLVVALVVLGPTKLPEAARQIGKAVGELRRISGGFQRELREAIHDPIVEADARAKGAADAATAAVINPFSQDAAAIDPLSSATAPDPEPTPEPDADPEPEPRSDPGPDAETAGSGPGDDD